MGSSNPQHHLVSQQPHAPWRSCLHHFPQAAPTLILLPAYQQCPAKEGIPCRLPAKLIIDKSVVGTQTCNSMNRKTYPTEKLGKLNGLVFKQGRLCNDIPAILENLCMSNRVLASLNVQLGIFSKGFNENHTPISRHGEGIGELEQCGMRAKMRENRQIAVLYL